MHSRAWPSCEPRCDEADLRHRFHCTRQSYGFSLPERAPSRTESKTWRDRPRLSPLNSGGSSQHARPAACAATGIEIQGPLEATQHECFDDALDLGTSLTLAAPAADNRDQTPSSAMRNCASCTLVHKTGGGVILSPILQDMQAGLPNLSALRPSRGSRPSLIFPRLARPA